MDKKEKEIITEEINGLYVSIRLWFLCDNIQYDKKRMKRMFNGTIDNIKKRIK